MAENVNPNIMELLKYIVKEDINNYSINVTHNKKDDGFTGEVLFLALKEKNGAKSHYLVVKQALSNKNLRKVYPIREVFLNEINFYSKTWLHFEKFLLRQLLPNPFDKIPKCLASSRDNFSEILIMENLQLKNFERLKQNLLNEDQLEFIFKIYGRFHAISFAYRHFYPEEYLQVIKDVKDLWHCFSKNFEEFFNIVREIILDCLSEENHKVTEKFKIYLENSVKIFDECLIYNGDYSAVVHGDCWSNNMLFRYNELRKVIDLRLLDFQYYRVGTPVYDLSYCFYSSTGKEFYDQLNHYLIIYHDSFSKAVKDFGCDRKLLYPLQALKDDWQKYSKFGFMLGLAVWKTKLAFEEDVPECVDFQSGDDNKVQDVLGAKFDEASFKERARDLIVHMYENDFL